MTNVKFYDHVDDSQLKFAVIISKHDGKWVLCRHRERTTYEFPGGHRESGETISDTAKRELYEETGAGEFELTDICIYSVKDMKQSDEPESYGMLYFADIKSFLPLPESEMEEVLFFRHIPDNWTYPLIMPKLFDKVSSIMFES